MSVGSFAKLPSYLRTLALCIVSTASLAACATTPEPSTPMAAGAVALPPSGLLDMCQRLPQICGGRASEALVLANAGNGQTGATGATAPRDGREDAVSTKTIVPDTTLLEASSTDLVLVGAKPADDEGDGEGSIADPEEVPAPVLPADAELFALLNRINQSVNRAIRPRDDIDQYGMAEMWAFPLSLDGGAQGDCEDYALEKREALIASGMPESALFLAVGYSAATGRHAVLVVSTDQGDYVLDNMTPHILPWNQTGYVWLQRQMPGDLLAWRHIARLTS